MITSKHWYLKKYNDTCEIIDFIVYHHYSNEDTSSILQMIRKACPKVIVPEMTYEEMDKLVDDYLNRGV
jgi:flavorubredoxin